MNSMLRNSYKPSAFSVCLALILVMTLIHTQAGSASRAGDLRGAELLKDTIRLTVGEINKEQAIQMKINEMTLLAKELVFITSKGDRVTVDVKNGAVRAVHSDGTTMGKRIESNLNTGFLTTGAFPVGGGRAK